MHDCMFVSNVVGAWIVDSEKKLCHNIHTKAIRDIKIVGKTWDKVQLPTWKRQILHILLA